MVAYGTAADFVDEYIRIGEGTAIESLRRFMKEIVKVFGPEYLRRPNRKDTSRLLAFAEQRGFPKEGHGPEVNFSINGHQYKMGYYPADGIYPSWPTFVKNISAPQGNNRKYFAVAQEAARKDVERAFGVLQSRFAIIRGPSRFWDVDTMKYIMTSCVILHDMIIEDERELNISDFNYDTDIDTPTISMNIGRARYIKEFIQIHRQI
ncbi:hypothetical protein DCAR_0101870 [Daucus carota subsp. sativus]|uniref:DDE Tnp4 domain-containing protein n=1 Tax=Daucus carota subsp. sativus TaxID=79200 RepID=A0AAF0W6V0_DAUCS|nr:PREDICTED: uncharacterized protein LOC108220237 [Daucus carota subsp. sativus]WOG82703.1 hypothetical protein DCAR_0101870 [Daucus carota subsp. sativus]